MSFFQATEIRNEFSKQMRRRICQNFKISKIKNIRSVFDTHVDGYKL
jgi:hypothetical protein